MRRGPRGAVIGCRGSREVHSQRHASDGSELAALPPTQHNITEGDSARA